MAEISEGGYLYLQRSGDASGHSTKEWGIMVTEMPMLVSIETKEPEANDWKDEDGEDVYNNTDVKLKAFDFTVGLIYLGAMAGFNSSLKSLVSLLTSKRLFSVYSPHTGTGKSDCYLKSIDDVRMAETGNTEKPYCYTFSMKCRCVKPESSVHYELVGTTITLYNR